jgi:parallel beta-helix repeat protein
MVLLVVSMFLIPRTDTVAAAPGVAPVHNVDTGSNYMTIQAAIDAPETLDGHTIVVDAGDYTEHVEVYKSLSIIGAGPELCYMRVPVVISENTIDVVADDVTVKGFKVESVADYSGIFLDSVRHCDIENNVLTGEGSGITLAGSSDNDITNNNIYSLPGNGIDIRDSSGRNRISSNSLNQNHYGIFVSNGSSYNVISANSVNSSDWSGIRLNWLESTYAPVEFNTITGNTVCFNYEGILLDNPSINNSVSRNYIHDNSNGVRLRQATDNTILDNTIASNSNLGILADSSDGNTVYDNLLNNTNNAWDDGANSWNTAKQTGANKIGGPYLGGNYWSDNPNPTDADEDGLGDVPYNIAGGANKDPLPLVTELPISIVSCMTPEGEPYPLDDIIISNGTWRREFANVTNTLTEVPTNITLTYQYHIGSRSVEIRWRPPLSPGEVRQYEIYALDPAQLEVRTRPYVFLQETGADVSLSWEWNSTSRVLSWTISKEANKSVILGVVLDNNAQQPPNYVITATEDCSKGAYVKPDGKIHFYNPAPDGTVVVLKTYCQEIDPIFGTVRVGYALYNDAILTYPVNTTLRSLNGTLYARQFVDPEYAVPSGNYILSTTNLPPDREPLNFPIDVKSGRMVELFNIYPPRITDLEPYTFWVAAEGFLAGSMYSNLTYLSSDKTLTVRVHTGTDNDWWGCFLLPKDQMVETLTAYSGNTSYELRKLYNYTEEIVGNYDIVVVRITPEIDRLALRYTPVRPCFIATAAYGTPMAPQIQILRDFRDQYLLTNPVGKALEDFYYQISPPIAEFITEHPALKPVVRAGLVPAVGMSAVVVNTTPAEKAAIVGLVVMVAAALAIWATRRRGRGPKYSCR